MARAGTTDECCRSGLWLQRRSYVADKNEGSSRRQAWFGDSQRELAMADLQGNVRAPAGASESSVECGGESGAGCKWKTADCGYTRKVAEDLAGRLEGKCCVEPQAFPAELHAWGESRK